MENQNKNRGQDRDRVGGGQDWEINYMTQKFNVSAEKVKEAVEKVGNSREEVESYLSKRSGL